jgi:hypothetical protein
MENKSRSVVECLEEISKSFAKLCDLLKDQELQQNSLTIKQFANVLGISVYMLKRLYDSNKLPICEPRRINGVEPRYTSEDVAFMREFLNERK